MTSSHYHLEMNSLVHLQSLICIMPMDWVTWVSVHQSEYQTQKLNGQCESEAFR